MNPNLTIGYMAAEAKRHEVGRKAARGWQAEQAATPEGSDRSFVARVPQRWLATIGACVGGLRSAATRAGTPARTAAPRLDRAG